MQTAFINKVDNYRYIICLILMVLSSGAFGQIHYSKAFTVKLSKYQLQFTEPVEGMYKVVLPKKSDVVPLDLKLFSKENQMALSYMIKEDFGSLVPHIDLMSLASTLAINDDHFDLRMVTLDEELLYDFGADWGAYIDFIPKISQSKLSYGRVLGIYRAEEAMAYVIIYYDRITPEIEFRMQSLRFDGDDTF